MRKAKPRKIKPPFRSKLEERFAAYLHSEGIEFDYEALKFNVGNGAWYTPDFFTIENDELYAYEVKGFWREAGRVRIKAAAKQFPWLNFVGVQWKNKQWTYEEF